MKILRGWPLALCSAFALNASEPIDQHPEWDAGYSRKIREATTRPEFLSDLVDHLPASDKVPTPEKFLGYIAGAPDHLTYAADVHAYFRALEKATPRVKVFSIGTTEEGREMILAAIADEETIRDLDRYRERTRRLADPRALTDADASRLISEAKPIYYLTGAMHSVETGSPEMLMELAYRLAVEETPFIQSIRANVITLITPVLEVDGRERMVDTVRWQQVNPGSPLPPLLYWGHYVAHDNNRDAIGLGLKLTRNVLDAFLAWHPQVLHDLHESIPFLYISTGTGPYNAWLDPLAIDEWERMANVEVQALTEKGMPGVWTHGFYDGWAPNYLFWVAHGHNAIGRFYETFGNALPATQDRIVRDGSQRAWFRPNPPLPKVSWSLRNNVNYQESGVLEALGAVARDPRHTVELYWKLGKRAVAKAMTEGPAAYVFDAKQKRLGQLRDLLDIFRAQGIEIQQSDKEFTIDPKWPPETKPAAKTEEAKEKKPEPKAVTFAAGSFIVRMDQPYSRLADALLDTQYVRSDERVYDDSGWTVGFARNLDVRRIVNPEVLAVKMHPWDGSLPATAVDLKGAAALVLPNTADTDLVKLRNAIPDVPFQIADEEVKSGKSTWPAGTVLIPLNETSSERIGQAVAKTSLRFEALRAMPTFRGHPMTTARVAILHTWLDTQTEGWWRMALDSLGIRYDYISTQVVGREPDLRSKYDVILFPPCEADSQDIINGMPSGAVLPWKRTALTPNLGVDETDDIRPGLGFAGLQNIRKFVEEGGLLVTSRETTRWAADCGLARWVQVGETGDLRAAGSLLRARIVDKKSPIAYGYDDEVPVYYSDGIAIDVGMPDLGLGPRRRDQKRPSGRGSASDPDVPQGRPFVETPPKPEPGPGEKGFETPENFAFYFEPFIPKVEERPRVILAFPDEADKLLMSGMLEGGDAIAGKPVLVDSPLGKGHILLFACNPIWRSSTQGTYALVFNAIFNRDSLATGWPPAKP